MLDATRIGDRLIDRLISRALSAWFSVADPWRVRRARRRRTGVLEAPSVSVPLATYDRVSLVVERTIPALLGQTHADIEVVVVGDGTPLPTWRPMEARGDERVVARRLRRRTRYPRTPLERWMVAGWRPRRIAARLSRGDWLLWMSDDDIILPTGVADLLRVAEEHPEAEVITGAYYVGSDRSQTRSPGDGRSGLDFVASGMPAMLVRSDLARISWNRHSWRKRWNRPSDYDLMDRLHRAGARFAATDALIAIVPEVEGTGLVGSRGSIEEDRRRGAARRPSA